MVDPKRPYGVKTATGGVRLFLSYNPDFIDRLKATVPMHARSYDHDDKSWYIGEDYAAAALAMARTSFAGFRMVEPEPSERARQPPPNFGGYRTFTQQINPPPAHYAELYIMHTAPPEVIKAAYKALAQKYHPDPNGGRGDTAKMQELNAAYAAIKKERKL